MIKINQAALEGYIIDGGSHSYAGLCNHYQADDVVKMQIDRTLQKLRRKGKIAFRRIGKDVIWKAVPVAPVQSEG